MRITYLAKHNSGGNDDEGAIAYALTALGHVVTCVEETAWSARHRAVRHVRPPNLPGGDLLLMHKCDNTDVIRSFSGAKVFFYPDLVTYPDPSLRSRCMARIAWMNRVVPCVDLGFCTDGDFTASDPLGKLVQLSQGADERFVGKSAAPRGAAEPYILFTGITRGGVGRMEFVQAMARRYGKRFVQVERGLYQRELADRIADAGIGVCPDHPTTDRYWSNRVYNAAGFGACIVHPWCEQLTQQYESEKEILYYRNRDELFHQVDRALADAELRERLGTSALERTRQEHLYRHRLERLLQVCRQKGLVRR